MNFTERIRLNHQTHQIMTKLAASTALVLSHLAVADEGVLEINQICAVNDGCFAGDDPGFPVEIDQSGSYVLTSDLQIPADTHAITLPSSASGSVIDLNGFTIRGPESCSGTPVTSCTGSGQGHGISGSFTSAVIRNGRITGMADEGIRLGDRSRLLDLKVSENGDQGIQIGDGSGIRNVELIRNGGSGMNTGRGTVIVNARASGNALDGMNAGNESVVSKSTARDNGGSGIGVNFNATATEVAAADNGGIGISSGEGGRVEDSTATRNDSDGIRASAGSVVKGSTSVGNGARGIYLIDGSGLAVDNVAEDNTLEGIDCSSGGSGVGVRSNVLSGNNSGGSQFSSCTALGDNLCDGVTGCP